MKKRASQRKIPRFKVKTGFPLSVMIRQGNAKWYPIKSFSLGGFGFYASSKDAKLVQLEAIDVIFKCGEKMIPLRGTVQYVTFIMGPEGSANYFGVKFDNPDSKASILLKTLLDTGLEKGHLIGDEEETIEDLQTSV